MPVCDSCGAGIDVGARFCGECGALVRAQTREFGADVRGGVAKARSQTATGKMPKGKDPPPKDPKAKTAKLVEKGPEATPAAPPPVGRSTERMIETKSKDLRSTIRGNPAPPNAGGGLEPMSVKVPEAGPSPAPPQPATPRTDSTIPPALRSPSVVPPPGDSEPTTRTEFQRLLDEVESGFDAILVTDVPSNPPPKVAASDEDGSVTSENQFDQEQAKALFHDLVVANAQPIRDFMIEIRLGEPHIAWIDHCEPAVLAILRSAEGMGLVELVEKVRRFIEAIGKARTLVGDGRVIRGEARESLIDAYSNLIAFFPEAFAAEQESNRREAIIVQSLLSRVPGLYQLGVDRIYGTGMASLGLFYASRPREIAALAGVSLEIAERVVERFSEYRKMASEMSPARGRADERVRLRKAVDEVARATRAYDAAPSTSAEKRVHRRERLLAMADVAISLARLGEVDRLRKLEALSFDARVLALKTFLEDSERRAVAEQKAR